MSKKSRYILVAMVMGLLSFNLNAQDDLLDILEEEQEPVTNEPIAIFKAQRLINGHTTKTRSKGELEFIIMHRFASIQGGVDELFGLDGATIKFSFEYGITDKLTLGLGRNSFEKVYDGFVKYNFLKQSDTSPFEITWFSSMAVRTQDRADFTVNDFQSKLSYVHQLLVSRKMGERVSVQLMPSYVHRNRVRYDQENDYLSLGFGTRVKLDDRWSIIGEYYLGLTQEETDDYYNSLGIGVEIETGGHVFQLTFTNSRSLTENAFITETVGNWADGDIHFGFNLSRTF